MKDRIARCTKARDCDLPGVLSCYDHNGWLGLKHQVTDLPWVMKDITTSVQEAVLTFSDERRNKCTRDPDLPGVTRNITRVQKIWTYLEWWGSEQVYKRLLLTWCDEGQNKCTRDCYLPGVMRVRTSVQETVTYLVWWGSEQVYKRLLLTWCDEGHNKCTRDCDLMKDMTGVQETVMSWTDEGCDRCTKEETVTHTWIN